MTTSCNLTRSSTLQFPNCEILNHRIVVASFEEKWSVNDKEVILLQSNLFYFVFIITLRNIKNGNRNL